MSCTYVRVYAVFANYHAQAQTFSLYTCVGTYRTTCIDAYIYAYIFAFTGQHAALEHITSSQKTLLHYVIDYIVQLCNAT